MSDSKVKYLSIALSREDDTFKPGEFLCGKVLVEFTQPTKVRALRMEVFGDSNVGWNVSVKNPHANENDQNVRMSSHEMNLSAKFYIFGSETSRPVELPVTQLAYPFSMQLPIDLPSSIEHSYGQIRYGIRAVFERPWKFDFEIKTNFIVVSNYDLNQKPQASFPIEEDIQKSFCYFCMCPWGKLSATISVPSSGFAAGQVIPVTVHCENESTVSVSKIKVYLQKKLKFHATSPSPSTKEESVTVAKAKRERPYTTSSEEDVTVQLIVPPLPSSGLEYCTIMDLEYSLKVLICFTGMHLNVERNFPILIGTVPLNIYDAFDARNANARMSSPPTAPLLPESHTVVMPVAAATFQQAPKNPWDTHGTLPPPYSASMYGP